MTSSRSAREVTIAVRVFAAGVAAALRVFCVSPSCERFTKYHLEGKAITVCSDYELSSAPRSHDDA
eukprot:scaffold975_cov63-Phaeocystis_antarctica.AAC.6